MDNQAIGNRIKSIRRNLGYTTDQFAKILEPPASKGTVSKWENGYYLPNNKRLMHIAELGNITVEELLYGDYRTRISEILLENPEVKEEYIEFVQNYFHNTSNKYPSKEEILEEYNSIVRKIENLAEKSVAQDRLGYHMKIAKTFLDTYLQAAPNDDISEFVVFSLKELDEAADNYETYFEKTIDEAHQKINDILKSE